MDAENLDTAQQEAPREGEAPPAETEGETPEQIIAAFEAKTKELQATRQQHLENIESAKRSREEYADSSSGEERVEELDDFITERGKLVRGISAELERRGQSELELRVEGEIGELDNRIAAQEARKAQVGFSADPAQEREEIDAVIASIQAEKERRQAQLQALKLKRIHQYNLRKNLLKEKGIHTEVQAQEAARARAAEEKERQGRLKESAAKVMAAQEARVEAPEVIEKEEKSNKWSWIRRTLGRAAPGGIYAFVKERRAITSTAKDLAAQVRFQEQLAIKAMSPAGRMSTGFRSERGSRAELRRIKEVLKIRLKTEPELKLVTRFNEVRYGVSRKEVEANHWTMDRIINRAGEVLKRELTSRGRADLVEEEKLTGFKMKLREQLLKAQDDQLVGDTINYAKLIRNALNPDVLDREVFQPLEGVAEAAAAGV